jgi:hypothetical protein
MTHYPIQDFTIQWGSETKTGKYLFTSPDYSLNQGYPWGVTWSICDADERIITSGMAYITEEQAASWGTDDMYIIGLVADSAGVTLL